MTRQERAQRVAEKLGLKINEDGSWYQYHPGEAIPDNVRDHLLDLEEEVAIQDVKITVAHRNISALMERAEKAEELMKRVSRDYHQNRNMKWIVLDIDNLLTAPDFRPEISTESEKGGAS